MNESRQAADAFDIAARHWLAKRGKKKVKFVLERDDGAGIEDFIDNYVYKGSSSLFGLERRLLNYIKSPVLDLGCGAGRVAIPLCRAGHSVMGIDISGSILRIGRDNSKDCYIPFIQMSMNQLGFAPDTFSTIICMHNTIGVTENLGGLKTLLHQLRRLCMKGGYLVLTSIDVTRYPDYETYFLKNFQKGRAMGQVRMRIRFGKIMGDWFDWLYVLPDDLARIASETGWKAADIFYDVNDSRTYAAVLQNGR